MTSGPFSGPSSMAASRRPPLPLLIIGQPVLVFGLAAFAGPVVGDHGLRIADLLQLLAGGWARNARSLRAIAFGHSCLSLKSIRINSAGAGTSPDRSSGFTRQSLAAVEAAVAAVMVAGMDMVDMAGMTNAN